MLFTKTHETHYNITRLQQSHPSLSKRSTGCTRQDPEREHSILLSVTHMDCVNQVCRGVDRCVEDGVVLSQAWSESQWTVLMGYLTISTNVRRYQTHHRWQFFSVRKTAHWCTVHATQSNCSSAPSLMQHLSEKYNFRVSTFCQVIQKHELLLHFAWVVDDAKCIVVTRVCLSLCVCVCLCVCLSAAVRPHYCTDPDVNWRRGRGCPLVVHYWTDLQSVHRLRCYGNITRTLVTSLRPPRDMTT